METNSINNLGIKHLFGGAFFISIFKKWRNSK
nr:MAG TPA: hypothetical protein [Caudoviricetes sp.]